MAQFKIYGHRAFIHPNASVISAAIHRASVAALGLPDGKRFHRFLPLDEWQFLVPDDRSSDYLIIEVMMFAGRTIAIKKSFYSAVLENLGRDCGIDPMDIELTINETPRHDWLIRGLPGDELELTYAIEPEVEGMA